MRQQFTRRLAVIDCHQIQNATLRVYNKLIDEFGEITESRFSGWGVINVENCFELCLCCCLIV